MWQVVGCQATINLRQMMNVQLQQRILTVTQATDIDRVELIQPLWNHYGTLSRIYLIGGLCNSVIVKHIKLRHCCISIR